MKQYREIRKKTERVSEIGAAVCTVVCHVAVAVFGVFSPGQALEGVCALLRKEYGFCESAVCVGRVLD